MQKLNLSHEDFMKEAIKLSLIAEKKGEVPVGAIIVMDGKIIAKAYNQKESKKDPSCHAEIIAIKKACKKIKDFRLNNCTMYVTLEPCVMCMGAVLSARLGTLVFGASQDKDDILSASEINDRAGLNHKCNIIGGVLKNEISQIVSSYFKSKRKK